MLPPEICASRYPYDDYSQDDRNYAQHPTGAARTLATLRCGTPAIRLIEIDHDAIAFSVHVFAGQYYSWVYYVMKV